MCKRVFLLAALYVANVATCSAASLDALLFPLTGEIQHAQQQRLGRAVCVLLDYVSLRALNGNAGVWKSISDNYDVSGNGFIDPSFNWTKLSATSTSDGRRL